MKVVSNASPLIFLSKLQELELLAECFGEIHIPQAVKTEIGGIALPPSVNITAISEFGKHYVAGAVGVLHNGHVAIRQNPSEVERVNPLLPSTRGQ